MPPRRRSAHPRDERASAFAAMLADALHDLRITHRELANALGINLNTVDAWTRVTNPALPSAENLERLAYLLDLRQAGLGKKIAALAADEKISLPILASQPFAALSTTNLRAPATSFIGREQQVTDIVESLSRTRLLTLVGAGGIGKTRLSMQVATEVVADYANGVYIVELAALSDPSLVAQTVALALGVRESKRALVDSLVEFLRGKNLLLVLDNCEHLLAACAALTQALIANCPSLRILATSRERLHIDGETIWRVPSLSLPEPASVTRPRLMRYEATRLFIERGLHTRKNFSMSPADSSAVVQICQRLDGIPLAIELAAACVRGMSPQEIAARLDDRFRLLTGGSSAALPRHQTLRATLDWSYDLLTAQERALFTQLAVFAGGWTEEAAQYVANPKSQDPHLPWRAVSGKTVSGNWGLEVGSWDLISRLVDQSLIVTEDQNGKPRYRMLETVREYAREHLNASVIRPAVQNKHAAFFLALAERAEPYLRSAQQSEWLGTLEEENDNLRAALRWSVDSGESETALRMSGALWRFWYVRGYLSEGRSWLATALKITPSSELQLDATRAKALQAASGLAYIQGEYTEAKTLVDASLAIHRKLGDKRGIATCFSTLGLVACHQGEYTHAAELLSETLALRQGLDDQPGIAAAFSNLGWVERLQGNYDRAEKHLNKSLEMHRQMNDKRGIAPALEELGTIALVQGDHARAKELHYEFLALSNELGDRLGIAYAYRHLGLREAYAGDYALASKYLTDSLTAHRELWNPRGIAECLEGLAAVSAAKNNSSRATRLLGAASAARTSVGAPLPPSERPAIDRYVASLRQTLGDAAFTLAWSEGQALSLDDAVQFALSEDK